MSSEIERAARRHREALLAGERAAASRMVRAYGQAWQAIQERLERLAQRIDAARERGEMVSAAWLLSRGRLEELGRQVGTELGRFAGTAAEIITAEQGRAVELGAADAVQLVEIGTLPEKFQAGARPAPLFARVPHAALTELVGVLGDGSPLRTLLDALGEQSSSAVRQALITGLAMGQGPRQVAGRIRKELGGDLARALTIARTETLRAYRESSRQTYQANADVVQAWIWLAALGPRCCAACVALHGTEHALSEPMPAHPNCRCVMVPKTRSWEALGLAGVDETRPQVQPGPEWFDAQSVALQTEILGPGKRAAYDELTIDLIDLAGTRDSAQWGPMRHTRGLAAALEQSGMPRVVLDAAPEDEEGFPPGERVPRKSLRRAIRAWRERDTDLRAVEIRVLPQRGDGSVDSAYAWVSASAPRAIRLLNARGFWAEDAAAYRAWLQDRVEFGDVTQAAGRNLLAAIPSTYEERLTETLLHEHGHTRTLIRTGNYLHPDFDWSAHVPAELHARIVPAMLMTGAVPNRYNIGEALADDMRRVRQGRWSRLNSQTYWADLDDLDGAWERALQVNEWLMSS